MVAPAGRAYGYGARGRSNVIVNNRYYGYGLPYSTYYSPGLTIGIGSYGAYYGYGSPYYGYGSTYYGYNSYPYYGAYGYSGSGGYVATDYEDYGWIRLKVQPRHADVFVDGYYVGVVDDYDGAFQRLRLTTGPHVIEIAAPGFAPITFDVRILPNRKIVYDQQLLPLP